MKIIILQIIIIILLLLFLSLIYNLYKKIHMYKHISKFSLTLNEENESLSNKISSLFWNLINKLSNGLNRYPLINKLSLKYDKYILEINKDKISNIDYFTIKLLFIIFMICLSLVFIVFSVLPSSIFVIIIVSIIGYFLPDIFWSYLYIKKINRINNQVCLSIKYISVGLSNNLSIPNAIKYAIKNIDGEITDELEKILNDIRNNISLENAYLRFYKRSKLSDVLYIYNYLNIASKLNISIKETFKNLSQYLTNKQNKKDNYLKTIDIYNYIFMIVLIIPVIVYLFGVSINILYFSKLFTEKGLYLVGLLIVIYSVYIYIIKNLLEGSYE